ncbi:MAG: alkaline phosphatase family protein [Hyphomonadaceae bacterium]|nr:alkaline phosphatase family protein [Hyphomonadaceae bacterium]
MINDRPLSRFVPLAEGLVKPIYADYAFANIADTIEHLLTGNTRGPLLPSDCFGACYPRPEKVVLFFIDSFGWQFWQEHGRRFRTTQRIMDEGVLTPISALFPSTTSASVSTLNLGVLPGVHALYEWNIYIPAYGEVIQSLAFSPLGRHAQDACLDKGYDPAELLATHDTIHRRLARAGVPSVQFAHRAYAGSAYNGIVSDGARLVRHATLAEALVQMREALEQTTGKALLSFYWASIDTIAHVHGPGTAYHVAEIASFWRTFDDVLGNIDSPDTLYLFTADHGHVGADARDTIYINERIPELATCLPVSPTGNPIYPNGSPRDVFLHVRPERRADAFALLNRHFDDIALILPMEEALEQGLFGPLPVGAELRRRLGDILILPRLGHFIWWREKGVMANHFHGHHGGLSPDEITTVLGAIDTL